MRPGRSSEESTDYAKRRDELHQAEIELRAQRERVAEMRRALPDGFEVGDPQLQTVVDGRRQPTKLSELFVDPTRPLVLMQIMYGKAQKNPCPMCTLWADGYDGVVPHLQRRVNFAVLVAGDVEEFARFGAGRGWRNIPMVSAAESDLKSRLGFENEEGAQFPGVSVFVRKPDGAIVHTVSQSAMLGDDIGRGMDLLSPVWNFLDLTPEGRGDWMPSVHYTD